MAKQNEKLAALAAMVEAVDKATDALENLILSCAEDGNERYGVEGCEAEARDGVEDAGKNAKEDGVSAAGAKDEEKAEENMVTVFELSNLVAKESGIPRFLIYIIINEALDAIRDRDMVIIREREQDDGE